MTDNEIIKALECCKNLDCEKCNLKTRFKTATNCRNDLLANTLDLINRQKAESERWKSLFPSRCGVFTKVGKGLLFTENTEDYDSTIAEIFAEASKECFAKVNEVITEFYNKHIFCDNNLEAEEKDAIINFSDDITYRLNNLLKEMGVEGVMKQRVIEQGYCTHDCEAWYECPACRKKFGSWSVFHQPKNENGTNKYCPHCKTELDGLN